jgi:hypothetical protein
VPAVSAVAAATLKWVVVPVTEKPPPPLAAMVPAEVLPLPQVIATV